MAWHASPLSPVAVAKRVDNQLATMKRATLLYQYSHVRAAPHPNWGAAQAACYGMVAGPGKFWIEVPHLDFRPSVKAPIEKEVWIADGKRFSGVIAPGDPAPKPIAQRPPGPARPAAVWFIDFSRVILSGLGRATHPLEGFVADARRMGFKVVSHERSYLYKGVRRPNYRIVALKGNIRYEIVIDGWGNVPTSINNSIGTTDHSGWAAVRWDLKPKALDVAAINFQKKGATLGLSPAPRRS